MRHPTFKNGNHKIKYMLIPHSQHLSERLNGMIDPQNRYFVITQEHPNLQMPPCIIGSCSFDRYLTRANIIHYPWTCNNEYVKYRFDLFIDRTKRFDAFLDKL